MGDPKNRYMKALWLQVLSDSVGVDTHITCKSGEDRTGEFCALLNAWNEYCAAVGKEEAFRMLSDTRYYNGICDNLWKRWEVSQKFSTSFEVTGVNDQAAKGLQASDFSKSQDKNAKEAKAGGWKFFFGLFQWGDEKPSDEDAKKDIEAFESQCKEIQKKLIQEKLQAVEDALKKPSAGPPEAHAVSTSPAHEIAQTAVQTLGARFSCNTDTGHGIYHINKDKQKIIAIQSYDNLEKIKISALTQDFSESLAAMVASVLATGDKEPQINAGSDINATRLLLEALQAANLKPKLIDSMTSREITDYKAYFEPLASNTSSNLLKL
jgi:hypothetical protein